METSIRVYNVLSSNINDGTMDLVWTPPFEYVYINEGSITLNDLGITEEKVSCTCPLQNFSWNGPGCTCGYFQWEQLNRNE